MGEIVNVFKELVAIKKDDFWFYVLDRSLTQGQPKTQEQIQEIIDNEFSDVLISTHISENEFYIITSTPINCKNC